MRRAGLIAAALISVGLAGSVAFAIDVPDYDFVWCTIGNPGNPGTPEYNPQRHPWIRVGNGSIDHVYRMAQTEVTTTQWVEFFNALAEHFPQTAWDEMPWRWGAWFVGTVDQPRWEVGPDEGDAMQGAVIPLRAAARLCNWLHNGKVNEAWAFVDGVYDTTTFAFDEDLNDITDDYTRSEDALFFVPSPEEWIKAVYHDPNRHGPGQQGWWTHPNMTDTWLPFGLPGEPGAETSVGVDFPGFTGLDVPLMSYPDTHSAWGLRDASGPLGEWTDRFSVVDYFSGSVYTYVGSDTLFGFDPDSGELPDHIVNTGSHDPHRYHTVTNVRLGSIAPCVADFDVPYGILDLGDIVGFLSAYLDGDTAADLALPHGLLDMDDVTAYVESFLAGCD
ncbi:MAG: hypothetical protein K8E66_14125 [Phycisphaerales bacterium]|nr:hypothetical protein [Phycisphaerales bacterium]